ncbi:hypothetical protein [Streptomyces sp. NPDC058045]|uniref:hypothetical protein n=1 Tax=Streptomyces sp. NPDC058045 TaxID=3346311 RepID=UPI0036E72617
MTAPDLREARTGVDLRLLRAAVFTAVCVALSAAGHVLASRTPVPLWALGAGFLVVFAVAVPLAGRPRSLPGIAAVLAVGQLALHTLFGCGQHASAAGSTGGDSALVAQAARLMCGVHAGSLSPGQAHRILVDAGVHPAAGAAGMGDGGVPGPLMPSLPMVLGHLLAAVAAGWLLRRGDLALLRLVTLSARGAAQSALMPALRAALRLVRALRAGLPGTGPLRPLPRLCDAPAPPVPQAAALQHTVIRRGPPAALRLAA